MTTPMRQALEPTDAAERVLLRRIAAGDREAMPEFYLIYRSRQALFLRRVTTHGEQIEELSVGVVAPGGEHS